MINTNVFATDEEHKAIEASIAGDGWGITRVDPLGTGHTIPWMVPKKSLQELIHSIAMSHGLPDYSGFYGYNRETREFVKAEACDQ